MSISKQLLEELSAWQAQPSTNLDKSGSLSIICTLGYHYVQLTIFRAIIRPFIVTTRSSFGVAESADHPPINRQEVVGFARTGVRTTTTAAAKFVSNLREEHFDIFWPQWSQVAFSSICFLDLEMALSSPDTEEAATWFQSLQNVRKEMRLKANMLPVLRLGLLRIDSLFWKGIDKVLHLEPHVKDALRTSLDTNSG